MTNTVPLGNAKVAQRLEPCDIHGCTWCAAAKVAVSREKEMGGLERLAVEWNPETCPSCGEKDITYPHSCYPVSDITEAAKPLFCSTCGYTPHRCEPCTQRLLGSEPNRFDPYEALHTIRDTIVHDQQASDSLDEHDDGLNVVMTQIHALRVYITGMER